MYPYGGFMRITAKVNVAPVKSYFNDLAASLKRTMPETIRMEAAAVVRRAMQLVAFSKVSEVRDRATRKGVASFRPSSMTPFGGTTNVGKRNGDQYRQWMVGRKPANGSKFAKSNVMPMGYWRGGFNAPADGQRSSGNKGKKLTRSPNKTRIYKRRQSNGWRAPDADWAKFKAAWSQDVADTKKRIKDRVGARGLTAKSWLDIIIKLHAGDSMSGIPDFVRRARPIASQKQREVTDVYQNGQGTSSYTLTVENDSGIAIATRGQAKLDSAISIRRKFFVNSLKKNLYDDAAFVGRYYPWAKVS